MGAGSAALAHKCAQSRVVSDREDIDAAVIQALVRASSCKKHAHEPAQPKRTSNTRSRCLGTRKQDLSTWNSPGTLRSFSTDSSHRGKQAAVATRSPASPADTEHRAKKTQLGQEDLSKKDDSAHDQSAPQFADNLVSIAPGTTVEWILSAAKTAPKPSITGVPTDRQNLPESSSTKFPPRKDIQIGGAIGIEAVDLLAIEVADRYPKQRLYRESWQVATYCKTYVPGFREANHASKLTFVQFIQYWIDKARSLTNSSRIGYNLTKNELYALVGDAPGFGRWLRILQWRQSQPGQVISTIANEEKGHSEQIGSPPDAEGYDEANPSANIEAHASSSTLSSAENVEQTVKIIQDLIRWPKSPHKIVFDLYNSLPQPRPLQLGEVTARDLLSFFNLVYKPNADASERYFALLDEYRACGMLIGTRHWNWAIRFAGLSARDIEASDLDTSLYLWKEMERQGLDSDAITFNILAHVALKARNFDTIMNIKKEMKRRRIRNDRYFHVGLISYYGVIGNGQGIRHTYKKMVDEGSVIDTVVLNSVITALIAANDPVAAEQVFDRMKALQAAKGQGTNLRRHRLDWKWEGFHMNVIEGDPKHRWRLAKAHENALVGPDVTTYRLLVGYHAQQTGNLDRVTELLDEITSAGVTPDGPIFIYLFNGFKNNGALPYSAWTHQRLEKIFTAVCAAIDAKVDTMSVRASLIIPILGAYAKCTTKERVLEVWHELDKRWTNAVPSDRIHVLERLYQLVEGGHSSYSERFSSA